MKMKEIPTTTPFEDLILGSQFVPVLARTNSTKGGKGEIESQKNIGIFQCRKCGANLLEEEEALSHYKSHVLETHKEYFSVVFGGLCSKKGCVFVQRKDPSIHFHCSHCRFSACEILDLPLHMEKQHLSFYKEVSLVLSKEDAQLNKVYKCGECNLSLQGKVSIVQHLLTHESSCSNPSTPLNMELANGKPPSPRSSSSPPMVNGVTNHSNELNGEETGLEGVDSAGSEKTGNAKEEEKKKVDKLKDDEGQEQIQIEINPLDLISTIIEEDMKSDNPLLPTQHFLLGHSNSVNEENYFSYEEYAQAGYQSGDSYPLDEDSEMPHMNGFNLNAAADAYYDTSPAPGVFQCNQCNEAFKYQYLLTAHKKQSHQGNILTPFKCHICGNEFTALSDLKRHTVGNHSADFNHFCQVCGHAFVDAAGLKQHLVDHGKSNRKVGQLQGKETMPQSPVEKVVCDGCSREFPSKSELTRHIVKYQGTCNPNKTDSLRCATCGDEMLNLEALKEHRRVAHPPSPTGDPNRLGGKKGFQCDYCGKNFSCRSNLRDHLVVHTGEKPYPCDICGKAFSFIHNMKTHRLTHNEGRNEMCPYCDKAYKSKISLYYHMKKGNCRGLSTKEVPEGFRRCTECLQMFASEERFQNHKAKGTCQMSYRCIHCGIRCSSQDKLDKHLQKGICTKSPNDTPSSERRRRHRRRQENRSEEPVCCERCNNYNRDCCCTFSCRVCNKRVFSIGAYISHQRFHLAPAPSSPVAPPVPRPKKERIRAAIMEKRRRKRKRKGGNKRKKASFPVLTSTDAGGEGGSNPTGTHSPSVDSATPAQTDRLVAVSDTNDSASNVVLPSEPLVVGAEGSKSSPVNPASALIEDDDSNSGSLTDLSTFIAPNLLQPVPSAPTASVGGNGQG